MNLQPSLRFLLCALFAGFAGCSTAPPDHQRQTSPAVQLANVHLEPVPSNLRRVAMLPIFTTQNYIEAQKDLDNIFRGELSKLLRFEVVPVTRPELSAVIQKEQIASHELIPAELIPVLRDKFGADAVLFVDLTSYRPYRPIAIGI